MTGFCITSSSLSDDTLSESDPVAKKRDIVADCKPKHKHVQTTDMKHQSTIKLHSINCYC